MSTYTWIKLYIEILDDPKVGLMPDWLKWRMVQLFLVAREINRDGLLGPVAQLAWRLRVMEDDLIRSLRTMSEIGIVAETPDGWLVVNFRKRQEAVSSTERVHQFRKRERNEDETIRYRKRNDDDVSASISNSNSSSVLEEGGLGGETKSRVPCESRDYFAKDGTTQGEEFTDHFGSFNGKKERQRWETLVESIGQERAQEIAAWAERKEIHLLNRGALMDSLETAAKKWAEKPGSGKKTPEENQAKSMENIRKGIEMAFGGENG